MGNFQVDKIFVPVDFMNFRKRLDHFFDLLVDFFFFFSSISRFSYYDPGQSIVTALVIPKMLATQGASAFGGRGISRIIFDSFSTTLMSPTFLRRS